MNSTSALRSFECSAQVFWRPLATSRSALQAANGALIELRADPRSITPRAALDNLRRRALAARVAQMAR